tara:strand:+ start:477 stop:836 length:360 start_codon:yes stop_codon:yes gene_type:complete
METITEKTTVKGKPEKIVKDSGSVNERVQYLRFWARSLLSLCVFGIYFYIISQLFITADTEISDSSRNLLQILVGALTVVVSSISQYWWASADDLVPDAIKEKDASKKSDEKSDENPTT